MRLQQLRYLREIVNKNLNLSKAAESLHTSQPGISRQIQLLEEELGVDIFVRNGKRIVKITPPGEVIVEIAERMLKDVENLKQISQEFSDKASGTLIIATTHTQARYALPPVIRRGFADATARYRDGVAVFTNPNGGLMFEASVGGQKFSYQALEQAK